MNTPILLFIMLTRWLDCLGCFLVDRENKFPSPHKRGIQKIIELEGTLRCQLAYPSPTARSALPKPVLTAVLSWKRTGSLVGDKATQRSLNWWLSDCAWWELRNLNRFHSFQSVMGFQLFWLVCLLFLHSCAHLWDVMDCLGVGFLKKQDAWHCGVYISVILAKNIWTHWTIFRLIYQQGVSLKIIRCLLGFLKILRRERMY